MTGKTITVLGAVGVATALTLLQDGHAVRLMDAEEPANGCS